MVVLLKGVDLPVHVVGVAAARRVGRRLSGRGICYKLF